jgi:TatD DNase family protein
LGFYISLSGIVSFANAKDLKEVAKKIPLDTIIDRN